MYYIKIAVYKETEDSRIQSGVFNSYDSDKINSIFSKVDKKLLVNTTDRSIAGGRYGLSCNNCQGTVFDALKVSTTMCKLIKEGFKESLCFANSKRFSIN